MTRNNEIIDNIFRDSLDGFMEEIPSKNIWKNISRKLLINEILRFSFLRLSSVLALLIVAFYFLLPSQYTNSNSNSELAVLESYDNTQLKNTTNILTSYDAQDIEKKLSNNNIDIQTANNSSKNTPSNITSGHFISKDSETNIQIIEKTEYSSNASTKFKAKSSLSTKYISMPVGDDDDIYYSSSQRNNAIIISKAEPKGLYLSLNSNQKIFASNFNYSEDNVINTQITESYPFPESFNNSPFLPERPEFSVDVWGSPLWIKKSLSSNEVSYADHINKRNATEKPLLNYSFGVDLKINYNNWLLTTGLNYSEFSENADYSLFSTNIDSSYFITYDDASYWKYDTLDIFYDPIDSSIVYYVLDRKYVLDSIAITNTDYDTTFSNANYSFLNTYKWLEIPLMFGREFHKNKFCFSISTGVSYSFLTGTTGSILHYDNISLIVIDKNKAPFKNGMFNYIIQAGVDYSVTYKIGIICKPTFRYNLNSMFDKSYPLNQRYYSFGLNCGLRYKF